MLSLPEDLSLLNRWGDSDASDLDEFIPQEPPKIRRDEYLVRLTPWGEEEDDSF